MAPSANVDLRNGCLGAAAALCFLLPGGTADAEEPVSRAGTARNTALEEVLVTARRREENIQDTPIAVTALGADAIREQGLNNTSELAKIVPSLHIGNSGAIQIYIRGVGDRSGFARVDPAVGVYLDNLFIPRQSGQLFETIDIASIQVLRGPQGTLFGKNTTGGAMVISLAKPEEAFGGYVQGALGNYETASGKLVLNIPITDRFFTRLAFSGVRDDGFIEDVHTGDRYASRNRRALLLQTRWNASDHFGLDALAYYGHVQDQKIISGDCSIASNDALLLNGLYLMFPGDTDPSNPRAFRENCERNSYDSIGDLNADLGPNPRQEFDHESLLLGATAQWETESGGTIKFIVGARSAVQAPYNVSDGDGGPAEFTEGHGAKDSHRASVSAELQVNGSAWNDRLAYSSGLFGMYEKNDETLLVEATLIGLDVTTAAQLASGNFPTRPPPGGTLPIVGAIIGPLYLSDFELSAETFGTYFQGSYDVTEHLQFTAGLRYTWEKRSTDYVYTPPDKASIANTLLATGRFGPAAEGLQPYLGAWAEDPVGFAASLFPDRDGDGISDYPLDYNNQDVYDDEKVWQKVTPMASLSYALPYDWINRLAVDSLMVYATWSTGFKSGFLEPRGVDGLVLIEPEEVVNREAGFKLDAFEHRVRLNAAFYAMLYDNMQIIQIGTDSQGGTAVVFQNAGESEITGVEVELHWLPLPGMLITAAFSHNNYDFIEFTGTGILDLAIRGETTIIDRSDEPFPLVPERSASIGAQYRFDTRFGAVTPRVDVSYKSESYFGLDSAAFEHYQQNPDNFETPAYTLVDARLTWENRAGDLSLVAYAKNLSDERFFTGGQATGELIGTFTKTTGEPRMYGVEIRKQF